jgi:hypothetical protein
MAHATPCLLVLRKTGRVLKHRAWEMSWSAQVPRWCLLNTSFQAFSDHAEARQVLSPLTSRTSGMW